jgi:hypothetical protein
LVVRCGQEESRARGVLGDQQSRHDSGILVPSVHVART